MEKRFIGVEELETYLGISRNTIYSWIWLKKIPYVKMGKLVRFDLKEIGSWVQENTIAAK
jgi:excisionase family DNA binding protein